MQKSKAYYRALCACLALLVVGGATAYYGINQISQKPAPQPSQPQKPVQTQETPQAHEPTAEVIYNQSVALAQAKAQREEEQAEKTQTEKTQTKETQTQKTNETGDGAAKQENQAAPAPKNTQPVQQDAVAEPIFQSPITGEVVMDYSMEHAIYDPTLEQYRTNNCVSIAGKEGQTVKAAADGTVANVVEQVERGITVVIHHNNGWETTYSQLNDNVLVKKGDQVKQGQEIGMLSKPTKYGAALGEHLDFAVIKDGEYVDPKSALAQ